MDKAKLIELAERLERASGPSRSLDAQIFILLDPDAQHIVGQKPGPFPQDPIYGPRSTFWDWALDDSTEAPVFAAYPEYTASLDAAMALAPDLPGEWPYLTYSSPDPANPDSGHCWTIHLAFNVTHLGRAPTPALALTSACLRTLSQGAPNE